MRLILAKVLRVLCPKCVVSSAIGTYLLTFGTVLILLQCAWCLQQQLLGLFLQVVLKTVKDLVFMSGNQDPVCPALQEALRSALGKPLNYSGLLWVFLALMGRKK